MNSRLLKALFYTLTVFFLISCSQKMNNFNSTKRQTDKEVAATKGIALMSKGQYSKAREYFSGILKNDPKECHVHFLNALSYQLEGKGSNYRMLDLASVGYQSAIKFCPKEPWPYYYLGLINYQKKQYEQAETNFALAMQLGKKKDSELFFNAFILSAKRNNDSRSIALLIEQLEKVDPGAPLIKSLKKILAKMPVQKKPVYTEDKLSEEGGAGRPVRSDPSPRFSSDNKQVFVDVVFILSREINEETRGVNLLNGLQLQYGNNTATSQFGTNTWKQYADALNANPVLGGSGGNPALAYSSLITQTIAIPTLTYNLNIFNSKAENDQVLSRPTLLARDGVLSNYFSGLQVLLGVAGLNAGQVQVIPLGLNLKIMPKFRKDGSINMDIDFSREVLTKSGTVGSFETSATAIKETTHTTANIHFGETVILSALSETLNSFASDKTPGLGDTPLIRLGFSRRGLIKQNTSFLILITPHPYLSFRDKQKSAMLDERSQLRMLSEYVNRNINPTSNLTTIINHLKFLTVYTENKVIYHRFYDQKYIDRAVQTHFQAMESF